MNELPLSPLAPAKFPKMFPVSGAALATAGLGIKYCGRDDVLLMGFVPGTTVAGVFTKSLCPGAPVDWCKAHIKRGTARALVVNAGNANAFTGATGIATTRSVARAIAAGLGVAPEDVYQASTGVIGEVLPSAPIVNAAPELIQAMKETNWKAAAEAIRTTDTFAKGASTQIMVGGTLCTITGIAKGSGMVAPDMATVLAHVVTDYAIAAPVLKHILSDVNGRTFNCITVDGDTSTSDMVLLFATGQADSPPITKLDDQRLPAFAKALESVMADLARQVVCDGEGASKVITVNISGAISNESADVIARSVANSPLVKTAMAGADANWGRLVMAVGKAGQPISRNRLQVSIGGIMITDGGEVRDDYHESTVQPHMDGDDINISVDVGMGGAGKATVWTCDLTHDYIKINSDYRS